AAAALGPAAPLVAAGAGGLMLANKARKSQTFDRLTGNRRALQALSDHKAAQPPAPGSGGPAPAPGGETPPSGGPDNTPPPGGGQQGEGASSAGNSQAPGIAAPNTGPPPRGGPDAPNRTPAQGPQGTPNPKVQRRSVLN